MPNDDPSSDLLSALQALHDGDLDVQLTEHFDNQTDAQIAALFNSHVRQMNALAAELTRVARELGTEGRFGCQMEVGDVPGAWKGLVENVNTMASNLTVQVRAMIRCANSAGSRKHAPCSFPDTQGETEELRNALVTLLGKGYTA